MEKQTNIVEMSVYEALNRKKLIKERIESLLEKIKLNSSKHIPSGMDINLISFKKISESKEVNKQMSTVKDKTGTSEYSRYVQSKIDELLGLIENYSRISVAISKSNTETILDVNYEGKTIKMSVAEAIIRKKDLENKMEFVKCLQKQYANAIEKVNRENIKVEQTINNRFANMKDEDFKDPGVQDFILQQKNKNGWELVNDIKAEDLIQKMMTETQSFEVTLDSALSISNATTIIEVEFK